MDRLTSQESSWKAMCLGAFSLTQKVIPSMLQAGQGTIIYTGATASLRGSAGFANLSIPKFGLRALAQTVAKEFGPQNIHVVHTIVDGIIGSEKTKAWVSDPSKTLDPEALSDEYVRLTRQPKSAWTHELDYRPFSEKF